MTSGKYSFLSKILIYDSIKAKKKKFMLIQWKVIFEYKIN